MTQNKDIQRYFYSTFQMGSNAAMAIAHREANDLEVQVGDQLGKVHSFEVYGPDRIRVKFSFTRMAPTVMQVQAEDRDKFIV